MKRIIALALACLILLTACGRRRNNVAVSDKRTEDTEPIKYFNTEEGDCCLTYPSTFTQTSNNEAAKTYTFTEENAPDDREQSITLSIEDNDHEGMSAKDYPDALELTDNMNMLSDNSFDSETYDEENDTSLYTICAITDDKIYKVEYTYSGAEAPKEKEALSLQVYDSFTADTLIAYAKANFEDLYGAAEDVNVEYEETKEIGGYNLTVFKVSGTILQNQNDQAPEPAAISVHVAVNTSGVCYISQSEENGEYVNIDLLTNKSDSDPESWAHYYYEEQFGEASADLTFTEEEDTVWVESESGEEMELTVYTVKNGEEELCRLGVTADGYGFVYDEESDQFVRIDR